MNEHQLKIDIARAQLGTATELFIRDRDPISVQVLACGACELLEGVGHVQNVEVLSALISKYNPDMKPSSIPRLRNQYWNAMKHFYMSDHNTVRDDVELLASFSDTLNDAYLWGGWHDYMAITGMMPIEGQVLQVWYYALYEEKLATAVDREPFRKFFPKIRGVERTEQKRRLRRAVEKFRKDRILMADPKTETRPLVNRRP